MRKKFLSALLALSMTLTLLPTTAWASGNSAVLVDPKPIEGMVGNSLTASIKVKLEGDINEEVASKPLAYRVSNMPDGLSMLVDERDGFYDKASGVASIIVYGTPKSVFDETKSFYNDGNRKYIVVTIDNEVFNNQRADICTPIVDGAVWRIVASTSSETDKHKISGTVKKGAGLTLDNLEGIEVELYAASDKKLETRLGIAPTDKDGKYTISTADKDGVANGNYILVVRANEKAGYAESTASVSVSGSDVTSSEIILIAAQKPTEPLTADPDSLELTPVIGTDVNEEITIAGGLAPYTAAITGAPAWLKAAPDGNKIKVTGTPEAGPAVNNAKITISDSGTGDKKKTVEVALTVAEVKAVPQITGEADVVTKEPTNSAGDVANSVATGITESTTPVIADAELISAAADAKTTKDMDTIVTLLNSALGDNSATAGNVKLVVQAYMDIEIKAANKADTPAIGEPKASLTLEITPKYDIFATKKDNNDKLTATNSAEVEKGKLMTINTPTDVTVSVGDLFVNGTVYVKHDGKNVTYTGEVKNGVLKFKSLKGFSTFIITDAEPETAEVEFEGTFYDTVDALLKANVLESGDTIIIKKNVGKITLPKKIERIKVQSDNPAYFSLASEDADYKYVEKSGTWTLVKKSNDAEDDKPYKSHGGSHSLDEIKGGRYDNLPKEDDKKDDQKDNQPVISNDVDASNPFVDVAASDPYYDAIMEVNKKGWMVGISDNTFASAGTLTRGMAAQILWNKAGNPAPAGVSPFLDVTSDKWYATAIAWAYEQGLVLGYDGTTFGPDDFVTTEQFTIMLDKASGSTPAPYVGGAANATRGWVANEIVK